jgi:Na+/H+-dicarboxylate symporter
MKKKIHIGLLARIIIAIALGIALGHVMPIVLVRAFLTFNAVFGEFLNFLIPLIIVGLVTPAIAEIGNGARKLLAITVVIAYTSTVVAGYASYFTGYFFFPSLIDASQMHIQLDQATGPQAFFTISMPPMMGVMTALILSFTLGLGITCIRGRQLFAVAQEFKEIVVKAIEGVILPLLPIYIFGIFLNMTATGQVGQILMVFIKIIGVIFVLTLLWLLFLFTLAGIVTRRNPIKLFITMLPAYFTALGTQSSAATIPVTLAQTLKNGVREGIAGFVIPLCATIHLSGSMLKIVACSLALMMMQGHAFDLSMYTGFIFMLAITMVAAPGVPGGAIMAALGVLASMLGFTQQDQALMIALYIAMDSFGTACNVTGDGALALMIDKMKV